MPLSMSRCVPGRDADHGEGLAAVERRARLGERIGAHRHFDRPARVQGLDDAAAQLAQVVVDDRDRDLAQDLVEVGLRIIDAVDQRRDDQQDEGAADREHAPPFGGEGSADAARHCRRRCRFGHGRWAVRAPCDRAQAKEREQRVEHGQRRQGGERPSGVDAAAARAPPVRAARPCTSAMAGSRPRPAQTRSCPGSEIPRRRSRRRARRRAR